MNLNRNFLLHAIGAAVAATAVAAPAAAQQDGFDKPLKSKASQNQQSASRSVMVMRQDDGENSYEVRIEDGRVTAKVNGRDVPQDRIVREDDRVEILGKDGEVLATFHVSLDDGVTVFGQPQGRVRVAPGQRGLRGQPTPQAPATDMPRPKVMVGIHMDQAMPDALEEAGLDENESAIVIERVIPDLPAEKAGIQEGDLITEIDGQRPATPDKLREVLMDKKPGDTVTFTVRRQGADKTIRVRLERYDADRLPQPTTAAPMPGMDNEALRRMLEKYYGVGRNDGAWVAPGPQGQWQFFTPGFGGQFQDRMAELDQRMAELDERLSKLNEQMARLEAMIERLERQRNRD